MKQQARRFHASRAKLRERALRRLVTRVSTACEIASKPDAARTSSGTVRVNSGSRMTMANAAFGSPQAILVFVSASEMTAYDCASLPVPDVVGMPIMGSIGLRALA